MTTAETPEAVADQQTSLTSAPPRHRALVAGLVVLHALLFLWTTVLWPAFQAPDEVAHVDYVVAHRHGEWLDGPGERLLQSGVVSAFTQSPRTGTQMHLADSAPRLRKDRHSFDALGRAPQTDQLPNQMVQHPPLYYGVAAGWSYLLPGFDGHRFDIQVWWLRLLSVLLLLPVPVLLFGSGLRLTGRVSVAATAALLPLGLPSYLRAGASVNNDALLVVLGAALLALLARVVTGDLSRRTSLLVGLTWGAMLLTKGTALLLPPAIVAAYLAGASGGVGARVRAAAVPTAVAGGLGAALGAWWWIRNLAVYGSVQPSGYGPRFPVSRVYPGPYASGTTPEFLRKFFHFLTQRVFGSLGLVDEPHMRFRTMAVLTALLLLLLAIGLVKGLDRATTPHWAAVALCTPIALCLGALLSESHSYFAQIRLLPGIQVRYFLPFMTGMVICVAVGLHTLARRAARWLPVAVLAGVALLQGLVAQLMLRVQYGTSSGSAAHQVREGLRFVTGWAPWPPAVTLTLTAAAACAVVAVGVLLARAEPASRPATA